MKNTIFIAITALTISASVQAQQPTTTNIDSTRRGTTVDSIRAKYKMQPMPGAMSIERAFPALGTYQLTTPTSGTGTDTASSFNNSLTVTMDSASRGIVWIEGLPQGRVKAYLRKSPATYRILPQKTESGKQIPEGTMIYDSTTNQLNIAIGLPYVESDPASVFTAIQNAPATGETTEVKIKSKDTKIKTKAKFYTATKQMPEMQPDMNATTTDSTQTQDTMQQQQTQPQQPTQPGQPEQPQQPQQPQQP
jgi:hypothetical protein